MTITKGTQPIVMVATIVSLVKLFCDGGLCSVVSFVRQNLLKIWIVRMFENKQ